MPIDAKDEVTSEILERSRAEKLFAAVKVMEMESVHFSKSRLYC